MAKCTRCGKKGLFLKLDRIGLCDVCHAEEDVSSRINKLKTDFDKLEREYINAKTETDSKIKILMQQRYDTEAQTAKAQLDLQAVIDKAISIKAFAKSIKNAMSAVHHDDFWNVTPNELEKWQTIDLDELIPEPELQCLSVKDLATKYRKVRKQITELCKIYEERYTTKTIAAMYKLMVLAMEAEFENILYKLQFGRLEAGIDAVKELTAKYYSIAGEGNQNIVATLKRFIVQLESLYLEALNVEYEYYVQRERAKEEQRAIREQIRQEAEERKRLEQERKKVESEENKYRQEMERITTQMQSAHDVELESLKKRLEEMQALVAKIEDKKAEIINLQNGKAGTVYIISNIGSFGDNVYKIGMTRRIEPQDRVNELGDASVPFPFDVHSFIFSEDAVSLENALHKELNDRRVNKVNLRKEFFNVTIEELQALVERIDPTAPFKVTALAEQYRQSLSISNVPDRFPVLAEED